MLMSGTTKLPYWLTMHCDLLWKFSSTLVSHQSLMFPSSSNLLPAQVTTIHVTPCTLTSKFSRKCSFLILARSYIRAFIIEVCFSLCYMCRFMYALVLTLTISRSPNIAKIRPLQKSDRIIVISVTALKTRTLCMFLTWRLYSYIRGSKAKVY